MNISEMEALTYLSHVSSRNTGEIIEKGILTVLVVLQMGIEAGRAVIERERPLQSLG